MAGRCLSLLLVAMTLLTYGCSGADKEMMAQKDSRIVDLEQELTRMKNELVAESANSARLQSELDEALAEYRDKEQVWLEQKDKKSVITMSDAVIFPSGGVDASKEGLAIVDRIADVAKNYPNHTIMIEGHTDDVPIGTEMKEKFQSNWELSSARACTVLRYLYWKHKIAPEQLSAIGYGEYRPLGENETTEGRARNRRVVIVIGAPENG